MKQMFLICNAHIDPMWQWEWNEGVGAALSTFRVAAELCEQYDAFVFNHNEAILYQWVEDYEPELFEKIRSLVQRGRWHIMGGWYLQPDCNMPNGESFIRQIGAGRRYFREKFGAEPTTAINFDPFGHTRGLVQIMQKSGFDSYIICRPYHKLPETDRFVWKGFAGSSVRVLRLPCYNSPLGGAVKRIKAEMERQKEEANGVILWGVGNHGGGPSRADLEEITKLIGETTDVDIRHAAPEDFFSACKAETWPEFEHSLQHTMVGCYSSQVRIKQLHRRLEHELLSAEKMLSAAAAQGLLAYPAQALEAAWRDLMFAQFHDILPGSSIQPVEEAGLRLLSHGLTEVERLKTKAFFRLSAGQKKAAEGELPVLVCNPHPYSVEKEVACELMLADQDWADEFIDLLVYDENGNRLPAQVEKETSNLPLEWRKRVVFRGVLAPMGMTRFNLRPETLPKRPAAEAQTEGEHYLFRGSGYTARLNRRTGLLDSYIVDGKEYLKQPSGEIKIIQDNEDPWGMTVQGFEKVIGALRLSDPQQTAAICGVACGALDGVHIIESGDVRTVAECVFAAPQGQAVIRYSFPRYGTELGVRIRLITAAKDTMFKYCLNTAVDSDGSVLYGKTAFGLDELRRDGLECVAQEYLVLSDGEHAFSVANDGTYAFSSKEGTLGLTLMRTPAYCAHPVEDRTLLRQDRFNPRIDQGERLFEFRLSASAAAERFERISEESLWLNQPPTALCFFPPEAGKKPAAGCIIDNPAVELSALKRAEDGDGAILRLFNPDRKPQQAGVSCPPWDVAFRAELEPFEVKTYRLTAGAVRPCKITE